MARSGRTFPMAGLVSPATLEQIRAANDIVDVVSSYIPLKRAGSNFVALCPFHREKTPSFNVNPRLQIFHCFGCHRGGDVFAFVQQYENIGFIDAVRRLAERAGIKLEFEKDPAYVQARHLRDRLLQIHEQIAQRWQMCLANDAAARPAREYLAARGVPPEAVKLFRLGYAPEAWDDTVNWAKSKGFELELVEKAGLIIRRESGDGWYDRFRGRLIFPICDEQGRVIAFSGRVLQADDKTAKYVNSPETPIFTKSKVFYGLDKTKRALLDSGFAIVCEGQLDLIRCFMAGIQNVVAPLGTALTTEHTRILRRYVNEVLLCFDSDDAGQAAAVRSLDNLLASGLAIRVAVMPAPHDPDSYIKQHGAGPFMELVSGAKEFFDYYLDRLCRINDIATDKGRTAVAEAMGELVAKTFNPVLGDTVARKTAARLGLAPDAVAALFKRLAARQPSSPHAHTGDAPAPAAQRESPSQLERWLLRLLFLSDENARWLAEHLDIEWVAHPSVRNIVARRLQAVTSEAWAGVAAFLADCTDEFERELVTEAATIDREVPDPQRQLEDVTRALRNQFIEQQLVLLR
ncbi:MAG: DNA primase, partial [Verrucomicrobiales bacterium]|nr:DNA primase [Verrucomicrobiales bacterium]